MNSGPVKGQQVYLTTELPVQFTNGVSKDGVPTVCVLSPHSSIGLSFPKKHSVYFLPTISHSDPVSHN